MLLRGLCNRTLLNIFFYSCKLINNTPIFICVYFIFIHHFFLFRKFGDQHKADTVYFTLLFPKDYFVIYDFYYLLHKFFLYSSYTELFQILCDWQSYNGTICVRCLNENLILHLIYISHISFDLIIANRIVYYNKWFISSHHLLCYILSHQFI